MVCFNSCLSIFCVSHLSFCFVVTMWLTYKNIFIRVYFKLIQLTFHHSLKLYIFTPLPVFYILMSQVTSFSLVYLWTIIAIFTTFVFNFHIALYMINYHIHILDCSEFYYIFTFASWVYTFIFPATNSTLSFQLKKSL